MTTVKKVKLEVRPLFLPQLVRLSAMLTPAFTTLDWTSKTWKEFIDKTKDAIKCFDILIIRCGYLKNDMLLKYDLTC